MKVKKFIGISLNDAVSQMKLEFGRDAVILHTKRVKSGGLLGLFGRIQYEVIGAIDPNVHRNSANLGTKTTNKKRTVMDSNPSIERVDAKISNPEATVPKTEHREPPKPMSPKLEPTKSDSSVAPEQSSWPSTIQNLFLTLVNQDINRDMAKDLIKSVLGSVSKDRWDNQAEINHQLRATVAKQLKTIEPWELEHEQKVVVLVGPTGVGKTTTIAKLAANYSLIANKRVGLITIDTYRMAAVEQLKTYADIIGVPLKVAYNIAELKDAMYDIPDRDLILIDTAGRSHLNKMQMTELKAVLKELKAETYLVISASTKDSDLRNIVNKYAEVHPDRLIVTKLDETNGYGILLLAPALAKVPIAFVTTGQSVPEDIEVADVTKMTSLVLGD